MSDIVIIGCGVAGLTAAVAARQAGLSACVLERGAGTPDRPGETLHPGAEPLFSRLGVLNEIERFATTRHCGIVVQDSTGRHVQPYGGPYGDLWRGFQISRRKLQLALLNRACRLGAEFRFNCKTSALQDCSDGGILVTGSHGELRGNWLFDGSGSANWSARQDRTGYDTASPQLTVCYGYETIGSQCGRQS